jgi:hypothetical protein
MMPDTAEGQSPRAKPLAFGALDRWGSVVLYGVSSAASNFTPGAVSAAHSAI